MKLSICLSAAMLATAMTAGGSNTPADSTATSTRVDPRLEVNHREDTIDYGAYPFVKLDANRVQMNGDDWTALAAKFAGAAAGDSILRIVYLGDSHIQADFGGDVVRQRLNRAAGNAGRGLIIPFKIAGTNQPNDYTFSTTGPTVASRLLKQPWPTDMPFTGIGVQTLDHETTFHITVPTEANQLRILYRGPEPEIKAVYGSDVAQAVEHSIVSASHVNIDSAMTDLHMRVACDAETTIAGVVLENGNPGVLFHSIGNNGATYSTYNEVDRFGKELRQLSPYLVIIALGTNEAFGTFTEESLATDMAVLIADIRRYSPQAKIMLVTPTECYRKRYRWRRGRRRQAGMTVNTKVLRARNVVAEYAREHGIPLYDTYELAGGTGAAAKMKQAQVLGRDGVHFTSAGYRLWGSLLSDALLEVLEKQP